MVNQGSALRRSLASMLLAGLLTGCGEPAASLHVTAQNYQFVPAALEAAADTPTRLDLSNGGAVPHDFTIVAGPGIAPSNPPVHHDHAATTATHLAAAPGANASATLSLAAGTYEIICTVPGHDELGMRATLVVR